jgi:hypothetical protein
MNKKTVVKHVSRPSRFTKLKQLLNRFNLQYEERTEGNSVVIDVKAKPLQDKRTPAI